MNRDCQIDVGRRWMMEEIVGVGGDTIDEEKENVNKDEGSNWYQEKGILVNEIERLRKGILDLSERQSVLEDFIEVEFSDKFERFLKKRDHLISMGFGENGGNQKKTVDGKRKSSELVELLKMTKEQTNGSSCSGSTDTISGGPPSSDPPNSNASLSDSTSSPSNSQSSSQQSQSLPVVQKPNKKRKKNKNSSTIEQQSIDSAMSMGEPKPNQFPPQRSSSSGPPDSKISKCVYSDSFQEGSGGGGADGHLDEVKMEPDDIKMKMGNPMRKRKRNWGEISSAAANSSSVSMSAERQEGQQSAASLEKPLRNQIQNAGGGEDEDGNTNADNKTIRKRGAHGTPIYDAATYSRRPSGESSLRRHSEGRFVCKRCGLRYHCRPDYLKHKKICRCMKPTH